MGHKENLAPKLKNLLTNNIFYIISSIFSLWSLRTIGPGCLCTRVSFFMMKFDKAFIISGDSDLIPSIRAVKESFPGKEIGVIVPIGRSAIDLKNNCEDSNIRISGPS